MMFRGDPGRLFQQEWGSGEVGLTCRKELTVR